MVQKTGATSSGELVVEYRTAEQVAFSKAAAARMAKSDKALTGSPMAQRALKFVAVSLLSG